MAIHLSSRRVAIASVLLLAAPAAVAENPALEEIVVTARKIAERIQDIPMSIRVLSGEYLDEADLSHLFELQFNVPGLIVNNVGGYGAGFSLRGISSQGGTSLSVASHFNGIYLGASDLAIARMFDLERIEIVKGPQGTLYGRNSTGGSINFITRAPDDSFGAEIEAAYGSFDTARIQGFLNLPLDKVDLRFAFIGSEGDGYISNSVDNRKFGEDDFRGFRASLRSELPNGLNVDLVAQHVVEDGASGELWLPNPEFLPDPKNLHLTTVTLADPFLKTKNDFANGTISYDLGFATLHSITGYARSEVDDKDDCAGLPSLAGCVRIIGPDTHRQWSQELQLVSPGNAAVEWLAGANYFEAKTTEYYYQLSPLADPNPQNDRSSRSDERNFAVYGQAALPLSQRWTLSAGLRYSSADERVATIGTGLQDDPNLTVADYDSDNLSWRIDLEFAASEDLLAYASIATGFKSGGTTSNRLPNGDIDDFEPEDLLAYEAGIKSQWRERRLTLNAAAFFYDFTDLQVRTAVVDDLDILFATDNAAKAEIYGIDTDLSFSVSDRLTLSGGLIWLPKRDFVQYRNDLTGDTLSGNKLTRVPEFTANGAIDYTHPLPARGSLSARLEYNFRSGYFYTVDNADLFSQDGFGLLNLMLNFEAASGKWHVFASGRNLTDEDYFTQVFIQSSPGYPVTHEIGFGLRF